jgi:hypothetical protein
MGIRERGRVKDEFRVRSGCIQKQGRDLGRRRVQWTQTLQKVAVRSRGQTIGTCGGGMGSFAAGMEAASFPILQLLAVLSMRGSACLVGTGWRAAGWPQRRLQAFLGITTTALSSGLALGSFHP